MSSTLGRIAAVNSLGRSRDGTRPGTGQMASARRPRALPPCPADDCVARKARKRARTIDQDTKALADQCTEHAALARIRTAARNAKQLGTEYTSNNAGDGP